MKGKLSAVAGRSVTFVANFDRFEHQGRATTVRLTNVRLLTGELLAERACVPHGGRLAELAAGRGVSRFAAPDRERSFVATSRRKGLGAPARTLKLSLFGTLAGGAELSVQNPDA